MIVRYAPKASHTPSFQCCSCCKLGVWEATIYSVCCSCSLKKEEYEVIIHNLFRSVSSPRGLGSVLPSGPRQSPPLRAWAVSSPQGSRQCPPLGAWAVSSPQGSRQCPPLGAWAVTQYSCVPLPCRQASVLDHSKDPCKENFIPNTKV